MLTTCVSYVMFLRESERLLESRPIGCFLVRVSESRFGYTLSFRGQARCRHYMIDQLPNGRFVVVGEPKVHRSLVDLVSYYQKVRGSRILCCGKYILPLGLLLSYIYCDLCLYMYSYCSKLDIYKLFDSTCNNIIYQLW